MSFNLDNIRLNALWNTSIVEVARCAMVHAGGTKAYAVAICVEYLSDEVNRRLNNPPVTGGVSIIYHVVRLWGKITHFQGADVEYSTDSWVTALDGVRGMSDSSYSEGSEDAMSEDIRGILMDRENRGYQFAQWEPATRQHLQVIPNRGYFTATDTLVLEAAHSIDSLQTYQPPVLNRRGRSGTRGAPVEVVRIKPTAEQFATSISFTGRTLKL